MPFIRNRHNAPKTDEDSISTSSEHHTIPLIIKIVICVIVIAILLLKSVFSIKETQKGVITTFGTPTATVSSGIHFKIPFAQKVTKVNTTTHGMPIGYNESTNESVVSESTMITKDFNFVNADFYIEWKVSDPIKYLFNSTSPEYILKNVAQSAIRNVVGNTDIDPVLTTGKNEVQSKIKTLILNELEKQDIGIHVENITIQDVEPPTADVVSAFKEVEDAKQQMDTNLNLANAYKSEQLPAARASADKKLQDAEATKQARIAEANGQVARFNEMFEEYSKNKETTKMRLFYETMEKVMPGLTVIIDDGTGINKMYPIDKFN